VPYEPGELRAVASRRGEVVAEAVVETAGPAVALGLEVPPATGAGDVVPADGEFALPVTVFAVDARGRRVPAADQAITFAIDGPGRIIGVGNGDPTSHEPDKACARRLFNGLAQVILQTTTEPGILRLNANADGLRPAVLERSATPAAVRPVVPLARRRHFVSNWRMSPIVPDRPDPNQSIADSDMNTWERIDPANGAQPAWARGGGYAIYRATFTPPKVMQARGGQIVFHGVEGAAEVFLNGSSATPTRDGTSDGVAIELPPVTQPVTVSVLVRAHGAPAGMVRPVELVPRG
jgi:beta-galactosidase